MSSEQLVHLLDVDFALGGGLEEEARGAECTRERRAVIALHAALVLRAVHTS